jgi:hypothetical protein
MGLFIMSFPPFFVITSFSYNSLIFYSSSTSVTNLYCFGSAKLVEVVVIFYCLFYYFYFCLSLFRLCFFRYWVNLRKDIAAANIDPIANKMRLLFILLYIIMLKVTNGRRIMTMLQRHFLYF